MTFIIVLFIWLIKRCLRVTAPRATGGGTRCFGDAMCPPPPPPGSDGARTGGAQAAFHTEGVCSACSVGERPPPPTASPRWPAGLGLHAPTG